jgi:hypothetical protein
MGPDAHHPSSDEKDETFCSSLKTSGRKRKRYETYFWNKSPNKALSVVTLCTSSDRESLLE